MQLAKLVAFLGMAIAAAAGAQVPASDSLVWRIQQFVNSGDRARAQALADSALTVRTQGTVAYGEALFGRAIASSDAASAERDYLRVSVEYPFSPRAEDATLRVAQLREARGDRAGARVQYERLVRDFPKGAEVARASLWIGRAAFEEGDTRRACEVLFQASERVSRDDIELRNQIEYLRMRCMVPSGGAADSAKADSAKARAADESGKVGTSVGSEYSVQVAAYARRREADALARRLKNRGFQVRVVGDSAPFRVRVGRYPSREAAGGAQGRMKRAGVSGIVVEAERR